MPDPNPWMPAAGPSSREWLVANGLGGYASGTVSGVPTRRYHGPLVAALPAPWGRTILLNHLIERLRLPDGRTVRLRGASATFRLEQGLPRWRFECEGFAVEKSILMPHGQNTVLITYRLARGDGPARLRVRPAVHFRPHDTPIDRDLRGPYTLTSAEGGRHELAKAGQPTLRLRLLGQRSAFTVEARAFDGIRYPVEAARGYASAGGLWSPGSFGVDLHPGEGATLIASAEPWEAIDAIDPAEAEDVERDRRRLLIERAAPGLREGMAAELVLAADSFLVSPPGRGDGARTVLAGYHWFTDWGRDTMISLEGLTIPTGRAGEARAILRTFAAALRDGLIPNLFPEGRSEGVYHTADATLWFFHALGRYAEATGDRDTIRELLPALRDVVEQHVRGTRFGIGVDPADGLLRQGAPGYQLTWMDAKVGDWVVTPRRGKAVEINALWYNALCLLEGWVRIEHGMADARPLGELADRARASFNRQFWIEDGGYLFDVVDGEGGDDDSFRPNQILALSLAHPVLDADRWAAVLGAVRERLLTPLGLRSLAPGHPDYRPRYEGDLLARDAAYHQGTVWGWLIGPYVDAHLRVHPGDLDGARRLLDGFVPHLREAGLGAISEVFDAEAPFHPRGCISQAWSVAEVLRLLAKTFPNAPEA